MFLNERQRALLAELEASRQATVGRLSKVLYASPATIRRDLAILEENGYLVRVRGGAVCNVEQTMDPPLLLRMNRDIQGKAKVAKEAGKLLKDGMTIFLDSSTTATHLCSEIVKHRGMTVITNNVNVFVSLKDTPGIRTIICGGEVYLGAYTFSQNALDMIRGYYADMMFFSCAGISAENQISDKEDRVIAMKQTMLHNSRERILLCTESKLGVTAYCRLCDLDIPDRIICDVKSDLLLDLFSEERVTFA